MWGRGTLGRRTDGRGSLPRLAHRAYALRNRGPSDPHRGTHSGTNAGEIVLGDFGRATAETTADAVGATGRSIDITGVVVHEVDEQEGLVVAERQYWGLLELLARLGLFSTVPKR